MPSVARFGDAVLSPDGARKNCAFPMQTSVVQANIANVFVNGRLVPVLGNLVGPHPRGGCVPDVSVLTSASATVFVGGLGVGRIGDRYGNNIIIQGSPNVFVSG
jgi:uncharacterized Zn-binding protein involved in type VI secretion